MGRITVKEYGEPVPTVFEGPGVAYERTEDGCVLIYDRGQFVAEFLPATVEHVDGGPQRPTRIVLG